MRVVRAAGILEGEGCFRTVSGRHSPTVACHMTDLDVLEELRDLFGGTLVSTKTSKEYYKPAWVWRVQGDAAERVMLVVYPYMFQRRQEAIDKTLAVWHARKQSLADVRTNAEKAAQAYLAGEGSLRSMGKRFHVSYETVRKTAKQLMVL